MFGSNASFRWPAHTTGFRSYSDISFRISTVEMHNNRGCPQPEGLVPFHVGKYYWDSVSKVVPF